VVREYKKSYCYCIFIAFLKISGDNADIDEVAVVVLSNPQYSRYRAVLKRVAGKENEWMHNSLVNLTQ